MVAVAGLSVRGGRVLTRVDVKAGVRAGGEERALGMGSYRVESWFGGVV